MHSSSSPIRGVRLPFAGFLCVGLIAATVFALPQFAVGQSEHAVGPPLIQTIQDSRKTIDRESAKSSITIVPQPRKDGGIFKNGNNQGRQILSGGGAPKTALFRFQFEDVDVSNALKLFSLKSGLTVTADPDVKGTITIRDDGSVSVNDALIILQSVLQVRGYTAIQDGPVLSIVPFGDFNGPRPPFAEPKSVESRDRQMTQVIRLNHIDASQLAKDLASLLSPQASMNGYPRMNALIQSDRSSSVARFSLVAKALDEIPIHKELCVYRIKYTSSRIVANAINDFSKRHNPNTGKRGVDAVAVDYDRRNSVWVVASPSDQLRISREVISRVDVDVPPDKVTIIR